MFDPSSHLDRLPAKSTNGPGTLQSTSFQIISTK